MAFTYASDVAYADDLPYLGSATPEPIAHIFGAIVTQTVTGVVG